MPDFTVVFSILLSVCISPHSCIVWITCPLPSCARCLYFLPVSFVLSDVSAGSSSPPSAYHSCPLSSPFCPLSPSLVPSFSRPFPCLTCHSCRLCSHLLSPSPHHPSYFLTQTLLLSPLSLTRPSPVSLLRTAPAPRGRPS